MTKRFKVTTLGCRTNQYESQAYRTQLESLGYQEAQGEESVDLCVVNTCSVTEGADRESRRQIRQWVRAHPEAKMVVTGCLVERQPDLAQVVEGIDCIVPNKTKEELLAHVFPDLDSYPEFKICQFEAHTRAFVKVQDGCNSYCTYCLIPYVRGRSRSRGVGDILREVEGLVEQGYREVVLTGINIGDYQGENGEGLAALTRQVDQVAGLERLRISSIDPDEVDEALIETVIGGKTTCPSMHIVLQSGSNVILKRMNRKYTRQLFLQSIERLKKAIPDFTVTTDVIVGFPGETEGDFQKTLEVVEEAEFTKVHLFPYSPRPRTRAALYSDQIPSEVIQERKGRLLRAAEKAAFRVREKYLGREMEVLTEQSKEGKGKGHTANFLPVTFSWPKGPRGSVRRSHRMGPPVNQPGANQPGANQMMLLKISGNHPEGLIGERVE